MSEELLHIKEKLNSYHLNIKLNNNSLLFEVLIYIGGECNAYN